MRNFPRAPSARLIDLPRSTIVARSCDAVAGVLASEYVGPPILFVRDTNMVVRARCEPAANTFTRTSRAVGGAVKVTRRPFLTTVSTASVRGTLTRASARTASVPWPPSPAAPAIPSGP